ncbi:GLPGLI family protein [Tenacibaculum sp. HL-MS23]|uniref:GLPGLI family protein n=1 Tax=unclassified Tenacibaculum TaxID=2635139 RepID=UPI001C4E6091|nr:MULTISPECIES: GLPGLI family protein [unclassified Tenacibaculum]QXP72708.1 GLPGLI family protein [Tenacibaculum sp. AHE14PA]QXP76623.1 GLPGLI family protein [Tenacibaculum sp. AHE15PA]WNW00754.1 GLPGLI family protein [Tenacibaculum sp. HL-MS23]
MKQFTTIFFLCISITIFSQANFQGKAVYQSKTTMNSDFGGRQMSEERKKQIMQRMKSMLEKTFVLSFTREESIYKEEEKLAAPTTGGRGSRFGGFSGGGTKYKNVKEGVLLESTEFFGKNFLISEAAKKPNWELGSETRQIGNYTCYKATLVKENDAFDWRSMRRPRRDEAKKDSTKVEKESPKQTLVTAWYTPQIPVSNGPGNYWGLPGLILEINEGRTTILCSEITMNPSEKIEIEKPEKGKKVTREEYTKMMKEKMEEMRDRFRGGRRGGGRGGRF